jgi:hypothetical protein
MGENVRIWGNKVLYNPPIDPFPYPSSWPLVVFCLRLVTYTACARNYTPPHHIDEATWCVTCIQERANSGIRGVRSLSAEFCSSFHQHLQPNLIIASLTWNRKCDSYVMELMLLCSKWLGTFRIKCLHDSVVLCYAIQFYDHAKCFIATVFISFKIDDCSDL